MQKTTTRILAAAGTSALAITSFVGVSHATAPAAQEQGDRVGQVRTVPAEVSTKAAGYCTTSKTFRKNGYVYTLPVDSNGNRGCTMGQGAGGKHVTALQNALKFCYSQSIDVDGIWGPRTTVALKNAQKKMGVTADGRFGPNTNAKTKWRAIKDDPNNPVSSCRTY
ncbi:peptidoglycan-binding protein [Streptomyces sp. XM4193]|uniref:peptidoglycan-binding domain-containing protein n=1 Tax=Streptomyces sp. XM4193 TaxID=2929782 RepID=UPI001FF9D8A1|nr:peptidoglycan-binding domain-containing protein [Streptomyces sp. XM4193]MCK1794895.1 peptidoglycan-binding protein [Streptomyces sp. XM4193]